MRHQNTKTTTLGTLFFRPPKPRRSYEYEYGKALDSHKKKRAIEVDTVHDLNARCREPPGTSPRFQLSSSVVTPWCVALVNCVLVAIGARARLGAFSCRFRLACIEAGCIIPLGGGVLSSSSPHPGPFPPRVMPRVRSGTHWGPPWPLEAASRALKSVSCWGKPVSSPACRSCRATAAP